MKLAVQTVHVKRLKFFICYNFANDYFQFKYTVSVMILILKNLLLHLTQ